MSSSAYYRIEAERCRKLAAACPEAGMSARWRQLASEYEALAQSLENAAPPGTLQPQAVQQQQAKTRDEK
jgi:hypothetical protein